MNNDAEGNIHYCIACRKIITNPKEISHTYKDGKKFSTTMWICNDNNCLKFYIKNMDKKQEDKNTHMVDGFCYMCGNQLDLTFGYIQENNYKHTHCKTSKKWKTWLDRNRKQYYKEDEKDGCVKPWEDPESLFCDTQFLNEEFGLDVRTGDECKD